MIRLAILYASALGTPALVLIWRSLGAGGNHWPLFGTALDRWLRVLGSASALLVALPLLLLAALALRRGYRRAVRVCFGLALVLALIVRVLVAVAAD